MKRWTIKELNEISNKRLIKALITERKNVLSNPYAPLYQRLEKLNTWVENNIPGTEA